MFSQFLQVGLVAILGSVVLFEYQQERALIENIPVSDYHRLPELPKSLSGEVLLIDLKESEALTRISLSQGRSSNELVSLCLSKICNEIIEARGTILATEGDMVSAFFDSSRFHYPNKAALEAVDRIKQALSELRLRAIEEGLLPSEYGALNFRGALASGYIRPIWLETGATRMAAWEQVGNSTPFLNAARYLELERVASEGKPITLVIMAEPLKAELAQESLEGSFLFENRSLSGKHDVSYIVSGYIPRQDASIHLSDEPLVISEANSQT